MKKCLKVLVVEDEATNREVAEGILSSLGHQVMSVGNGQEAVDLVASGENGFDVILMDVLMPVMDGFAATRHLREFAQTREVPIICVSQLNRSPDARNDKRPMLSDLRESGAIEQDADLVLMIYRDDYYNPDSEEKGVAEVLVAKNRHGPTDRVKLTFRGSYAKFDNLARD